MDDVGRVLSCSFVEERETSLRVDVRLAEDVGRVLSCSLVEERETSLRVDTETRETEL